MALTTPVSYTHLKVFVLPGVLTEPVTAGRLLAKVNDRQLQAQLKRLEAQIPLAEDRVFRQTALLKRAAVSKEAYEQVKTELATLNADIENITMCIRDRGGISRFYGTQASTRKCRCMDHLSCYRQRDS